MALLFNLLVAATLVSGVAGWMFWIRAATGRRLWLPAAETHPPCRWGLFDLFLLAALWLLGGMCASRFAAPPLPAANETAETQPSAGKNRLPPHPLARLTTAEQTRFLLATGCASLAVTALAAGLIAWRTGSRWEELGLSCGRLPYDVQIGGAAFAMTAPLILAVQAALVAYWPSQHPLIEALQADWSEALYAAVCCAAVLGAPVIEEFAFRVLLYGWLRNWAVAPPSGHELLFGGPPAFGNHAGESQAALGVAPAARLLGRGAAMLLSSVAFGLMHWDHGPDWVPLTLLGLVLAWLYERTGRIWPCLVVHLLLNSFTMLGLRIAILHS